MNQLSLPTLEFICFVAILVPAIGLYWFRQPRHQQEIRRRKFQKLVRKLDPNISVFTSENHTPSAATTQDKFAYCLPFFATSSFVSLLHGHHQQLAFELFDYMYTAEDGNEVQQTVLICQTHQPAPAFLVRPQGLATLFQTPQLYKLIHLPVLTACDYTLSISYETDETAVEMLKRLPANTWTLLRERKALLACNGEQLVYFYHGRLLTAEPAPVKEFISEGLAIATVLATDS